MRVSDVRYLYPAAGLNPPVFGAIIQMPSEYHQAPAIVSELIAQEIVRILGGGDYAFFEGWKSRNKFPGFAVYSSDGQHILSLKQYYPTIADRVIASIIDGQDELFFGIESPRPKGIASLAQQLSAVSNLRIRKPLKFYSQFKGMFIIPEDANEKLEEALGVKIASTQTVEGPKYLLVLKSDNDEIKYIQGYFLGLMPRADYHGGGIFMTSADYKDKEPAGHGLDQIISIFGKGLEQLYVAMRMDEFLAQQNKNPENSLLKSNK